MSETTSTDVGAPDAPTPPPESSETAAVMAETSLSIRSLLEAGAHFGHQTDRWNPRMRRYIFGARNGTHIIDLDQTYPMFRQGLEFIRDTTAAGGKVLFVGTKRQAAPTIREQAERAGQYYVNNRWLGGMLTNWKTVKKSIDHYKTGLDILGDEEKMAELSKKELARVRRNVERHEKSLAGIKDMSRLPDAMFIIDVIREQIAVSEARRLGIPTVAIVDTNCNPAGIDFVVPGNDDAIRSLGLYCTLVANACLEGAEMHNDQLQSEGAAAADERAGEQAAAGGRRVVEIKQAPRRGRGQGGARGGGTSGRTHSSGGWADKTPGAATPDAPAAAPTAAAEPAVPAEPAAPAEAAAPAEPAPEPAAPAAPEPEAVVADTDEPKS